MTTTYTVCKDDETKQTTHTYKVSWQDFGVVAGALADSERFGYEYSGFMLSDAVMHLDALKTTKTPKLKYVTIDIKNGAHVCMAYTLSSISYYTHTARVTFIGENESLDVEANRP